MRVYGIIRTNNWGGGHTMHSKRHTTFAGALFCWLVAFCANAADNVANKWQSDTTEGLSGSYLTVGHWNGGHVPESGEFADFRSSSSYSVTMPTGTYASPSGFRTGLTADSTTLRMDFSNTIWTDPGYETGGKVYGAWLDADSGIRTFLLECGTGYGDAAASKMSGCVIDIVRGAGNTVATSFSGGSVNFYDPEGTAHGSAQLRLNGNSAKLLSSEVAFDGTDTRIPKMQFRGYVTNGVLNLKSGLHELFGDIEFIGSNGSAYTNTLVIGPGAVVTNHSTISFGGNASNRIRVNGTWAPQNNVLASAAAANGVITVLDGGNVKLPSNFKLQSKGQLSLTAEDGASVSISDGVLRLNDAGYTGTSVLNVSGGVVSLASIYGYAGTAEINVSAGRLEAGNVYLGFTDDAVSTFRITGGESVLGVLYAGHNTASPTASVVLDGGILSVQAVSKRDNGFASFSANGGTIRAVANSSSFIAGLDSARLGEKGLTIDTGSCIIIVPQAFSDADAVSGRLVKTGSGTLTLSATSSAPSEVAAADGTLAFASGACIPASLVVTNGASLVVPDATSIPSLTVDGGVLTLGADCTISAGSVSLSGVLLSLSGSVESGDTLDLITTTAEPSEEAVAAWSGTHIVSGLLSGLSHRFTVVADGGVWRFRISVVTAETVEAENPNAGTKTDSVNRLGYGDGDTLAASAVAGGTIVLDGTNRLGKLVKNGAGTVRLLNAANLFPCGVTLNEGTLFVSPLAALGLSGSADGLTLAGGTLEIDDDTASPAVGTFPVSAQAGSGKAYVIKTDTDVSLPLPSVVSGDLIKRGAGSLTFRASGVAGALTADNGAQPDGKTVTPSTEIVFDADGTPPTAGYSGLNVAEGLLAVKGDGADSTTVSLRNLAYVGLPVRGLSKQPGIGFEDCTVSISASTGQSIEIGSGMTQGASDVTAPTFTLTNAVFGNIPIFRVGSGSTVAIRPVVSCYNSTLSAKIAELNLCTANGSEALYAFTDGSVLRVDDFRMKGKVYMTFDNSRLAGLSNPLAMPQLQNNKGMLDITFRNDGEFAGAVVTRGTYGNATATLRFDGGRWMPGSGSVRVTNDWISVVSTGDGLVLAPDDGDTWNFELGMEIDCQAPVVVTGEGTVSFGSGCAEGLVLCGSGTVANSTLTNTTIIASAAVQSGPVLNFANVSFAKRTVVDLGRTEEDPLPQPFSAIRVANFTGTPPDVGGWRLAGTGNQEVRGDFSVHDGGVWVMPRIPGMLILVK